MCASGNGVHALDALGGQMASHWHGWSAVHGHARAELARGIGPLGRDGAGGDVMCQEMVGGALPRSGVHGGHGEVWAGVG
jgi:hypothetical protein